MERYSSVKLKNRNPQLYCQSFIVKHCFTEAMRIHFKFEGIRLLTLKYLLMRLLNEKQKKGSCCLLSKVLFRNLLFYKEKYIDSFGVWNWSVHCLWFGSWGTFGESMLDFKLDTSTLKQLFEDIVAKTIHIYN